MTIGRSCDGCLVLLLLSCGCAGGGNPDGRLPSRSVEDVGPGSASWRAPEARSVAESEVRFVGRYDDADPRGVRFSWSGTGFVVRFRGPAVWATMSGGRYFTVVVDGVVQAEPLAVSDDGGTYELASGLSGGVHTVEVYRRTEGHFGPTLVHDIHVDGELLEVPPPKWQLEVVGDSGVTGYGVEGAGPTCAFSAETENHFSTWNALTARALGAELGTVAWSGKGVVLNHGGDHTEPMPALYHRVIATEPGSTGIIRQANLVLVALGANDYGTGSGPSDDAFVPAYAGLLEQIRARHPAASILAIFPRMNDGRATARARSAIEAAVARRRAAGDARVRGVDLELDDPPDFGCDYHFGVESHAEAAELVIEYLRREFDG